jgi:hypothetical protein
VSDEKADSLKPAASHTLQALYHLLGEVAVKSHNDTIEELSGRLEMEIQNNNEQVKRGFWKLFR